MKVSICIPAYKQPQFLKRCLNSIFEQDFTDYEIIITDDSPDDTLQRLTETYDDKRICYYKNEKPLGSPLNWNEGIKKAKGGYIKILHHDDWLATPQSLGKYVALLDDNPEANIAFSGSCDIKGKAVHKKHIAKDSFLKELKTCPETIFLGNHLGAPSVCIFRNHKNFFFDPNLIWLVDIDFYIRAISTNNEFAYSSEVLVYIGISEHQITQQCMSDTMISLKEKMYVFNKFSLNNKSWAFHNNLIRAFGRNNIFGNKSLYKILPDSGFQLTGKDSLVAYYYYIKKKIRNLF